ncbi:MAG: PilZ domain-containing protein [Spirochaetes bacterium]|nr:PilZ domain-containing protein [Spirochaetota bacterium]MBU0955611.1 PilZ domain-containing protein [Spirochaetota bacterium]
MNMNSLNLAQGMVLVETKPENIRFLIIVVGAIAFLIIVSKIVKAIRNGGSGGKTSSSSGSFGSSASTTTKTLSHGSFLRQASTAGFSANEAAFLERYARQLNIINPSTIFADSNKLDSFMQSVYKNIEHYAKTEDMAEEEKAQLFAIREAAGHRMKTGRIIHSTHQLKPKLPISMQNNKGNNYSTILLKNDSSGMFIEQPKDAFGDYIRFRRGAKLTTFFYTGNHQGYQFKTKVQRSVEINGRSYLILGHSSSISSLPSRKHERTAVHLACRYFRVQVQVSGHGKNTKRIVNTEKSAIAGIITDVSVGGLSIQTVTPLPAGEFIKIQFDAGFGDRIAWANIVRTNRLRNSFAMHVKFVKISRKTANELHALVFSYV